MISLPTCHALSFVNNFYTEVHILWFFCSYCLCVYRIVFMAFIGALIPASLIEHIFYLNIKIQVRMRYYMCLSLYIAYF